MSSGFREIFDRYLNANNIIGSSRDFSIQYSVLIPTIASTCMRFILFGHSREIAHIKHMEYSSDVYIKDLRSVEDPDKYLPEQVSRSDETHVVLHKDGKLIGTINCCYDYRGRSSDNYIYAIDLYPDYKPKHFTGTVLIG